MRKRFEVIMSVLMITLVLTASVYYNTGKHTVEVSKEKKKDANTKDKIMNISVAIDAGHGGYDPGKVGINGELEKDINLDIALKLQKKCEEAGMEVLMTRVTDTDLAEEGLSKKTSDMKNRIDMINKAKPDLCISIHQNSYTSKGVKGAQVFYYSGSEEGEKFAEIIQHFLIENVDKNNHRKAKSDNSYYMLKNSECPSVIVECGFLSNWNDATNLKDEFYQEKIADAIYKGIIEYITV